MWHLLSSIVNNGHTLGHLSCRLFLLDNEKFAKSCKKQEETCFVSSWKEHLFLSKCRTSIRWLDPLNMRLLWYVVILWSYAFSSLILLQGVPYDIKKVQDCSPKMVHICPYSGKSKMCLRGCSWFKRLQRNTFWPYQHAVRYALFLSYSLLPL